MKKRTKILAMVMAVVTLMSVICAQAFAATTPTNDYDPVAAYQEAVANAEAALAKDRTAVKKYCFTTGDFGSAEASGICGWKEPPAGEPRNVSFGHLRYDNGNNTLSDNVTWSIKNDVLFITGTGKTMGGCGRVYDHYCPWDGNENVKTVIIDEGITDCRLDFADMPNLKTVITMSNKTQMSGHAVMNCPNAKTIIFGANMKDDKQIANSIYSLYGIVYRPGDDMTHLLDKHAKDEMMCNTNFNLLHGRGNPISYPTPNAVVLSSHAGDWDARVATAKRLIADADLSADALTMLPKELDGGGASGTTKPVDKPVTPDPVPPVDNTDEVDENAPGRDPMEDYEVSDWAYSYVNDAFWAGIIPESIKGNLAQPITRSQFCAIANAVYETKTGTTVTYNGNPFKDVDDSNTAVLKMASKGVVSGYGGGMFGPNDRITREQAATMIARLSAAMGDNLPSKATSFTDKFNTWAIEPVSKVYGAGIMNGYSKTAFGAKDSYTIEQSIVSLYRTFQYGQVAETPDAPVEEENTTPPQPEVPDKPSKPTTENVYTYTMTSGEKLVKDGNKVTVKADIMTPNPDTIFTVNADGTVTKTINRSYGTPSTYDAVIIKDANGNVVFDSKNA